MSADDTTAREALQARLADHREQLNEALGCALMWNADKVMVDDVLDEFLPVVAQILADDSEPSTPLLADRVRALADEFLRDRAWSALAGRERREFDPPESVLDRVEERYTADEVPPCRVCGGELSIGSIGGGEATRWGCAVPDGVAFKDWHYGESQWTQRRGGDSDVVGLVGLVRALLADDSDAPTIEQIRAEAKAEHGERIAQAIEAKYLGPDAFRTYDGREGAQQRLADAHDEALHAAANIARQESTR